jgi:hypothetical protein
MHRPRNKPKAGWPPVFEKRTEKPFERTAGFGASTLSVLRSPKKPTKARKGKST